MPLWGAVAVAAGEIERVSVDSSGGQAEGGSSHRGSISPHGRFVVFSSEAHNLVVGDSNRFTDIFVHDRSTRDTTRVSLAWDGEQGNEKSTFGIGSADGRYVVFGSRASNLAPNDWNGTADIFLRDRVTSETTFVSVSSNEELGNAISNLPDLTPDGRYAAFVSRARNLVPNDANGVQDVFVRDLWSGTTVRVSVDSQGREASGSSTGFPELSPGGRFVVFSSLASNLVGNDTNKVADVFIHDRDADENGIFDEPGGISTERVSVTSAGEQADQDSYAPALSPDGRYVAFVTSARLIGGDLNQTLDVYLRDRVLRVTSLISIKPNKWQSGNGPSKDPSVSADGRYVAFESWASDLVPNDTNNRCDVFLRDRLSETTIRLSVSSSGEQGEGNSGFPVFCANGRFVLFDSKAENLVEGDTNGAWDVFVRELFGCEAFTPCDANCDGSVDLTDVEPFISALLDPGRYVTEYPTCDIICNNDLNADGSVDLADVEPFIACLLGEP